MVGANKLEKDIPIEVNSIIHNKLRCLLSTMLLLGETWSTVNWLSGIKMVAALNSIINNFTFIYYIMGVSYWEKFTVNLYQ